MRDDVIRRGEDGLAAAVGKHPVTVGVSAGVAEISKAASKHTGHLRETFQMSAER